MEAFLIDRKESTKLLHGYNAPLETFSSRISAAYCLGLISKAEEHDLNILKKIRNEIVHDINSDFDTPKIADLCSTLPQWGKKGDAYSHFNVVSFCLINYLIHRTQLIAAKHKLKYIEWPSGSYYDKLQKKLIEEARLKNKSSLNYLNYPMFLLAYHDTR